MEIAAPVASIRMDAGIVAAYSVAGHAAYQSSACV